MSQIDTEIYDAIIIGAGAAGLGAARTLIRGGARVLVLEARGRVGGRVYSDNTTFPIPVDLGAQWFHQGPANSLRAIAQQEGYTLVHDIAPRVIYENGQPLDATDLRVVEFGTVSLGITDAINTAGGAVAGGGPADHAASDVLDGFKLSDYYNMATVISNPFSHKMDELSVLDFANFYDKSLLPPGSGLGDEFLLPTGMGNFIADLAAGIPVMLSTPVKEIGWGDAGVQITTASNTVLRAKTVVVTASVGVLAHGDLTFTPALDPAYPQAFKGLKMETLTKVFLQFNSEVKLELPNINCMCVPLTTEAKVPFINAALWGENIAMMLLTGYLAEDTEQKSEEEIVDYTLETMRTLFGNDKINRANLLAHSHHSWLKDEWSRGCTSYATPGGVAYRKTLGKPVNKQVFFAGEAVSLYAHSSMHGAYETGADAARQILKLLR